MHSDLNIKSPKELDNYDNKKILGGHSISVHYDLRRGPDHRDGIHVKFYVHQQHHVKLNVKREEFQRVGNHGEIASIIGHSTVDQFNEQ